MNGLLGVQQLLLLLPDQFLLHEALLKKPNVLVELEYVLLAALFIIGMLLSDVIEPERGLPDRGQTLLEQFDFLFFLFFLVFAVVWPEFQAVYVPLDVFSVFLSIIEKEKSEMRTNEHIISILQKSVKVYSHLRGAKQTYQVVSCVLRAESLCASARSKMIISKESFSESSLRRFNGTEAEMVTLM